MPRENICVHSRPSACIATKHGWPFRSSRNSTAPWSSWTGFALPQFTAMPYWMPLRRDLRLVSDEIKIGAGGHLYIFVHPSSAGGVLLELVEDAPVGV